MCRKILNVCGIWVLIVFAFESCMISTFATGLNISKTLQILDEDYGISGSFKNIDEKEVFDYSVLFSTDTNVSKDFLDLRLCHNLCISIELSQPLFNCECRNFDWHKRDPTCIEWSRNCDGWADCEDGSDELDCICAENELQCNGCDRGGGCDISVLAVLFAPYHCIQLLDFDDGIADCLLWIDELQIDTLLESYSDFVGEVLECPVVGDKCNLIDSQLCDGIIDCPQLVPHDESNCSGCPSNLPNRCDCNKEGNATCSCGQICYDNNNKCDGNPNCWDYSDEFGCPTCADDLFACNCMRDPDLFYWSCRYDEGCIPMQKYRDGKIDCPDGSDEPLRQTKLQCGESDMYLYRFDNIDECNDSTGPPPCNNSICFETPYYLCSVKDCNMTEVICSSFCAENADEQGRPLPVFQCSDGNLIIASQFCDGKIDCPDNSDEIRNELGFKCTQFSDECVMPQPNLHDNVAHCDNAHDLCDDDDSCFECFDGRLWISSEQVCDDVIDCYDLSDECLCDININKPNCDTVFDIGKNISTISCTINVLRNKIIETLLTSHPFLINSLIPGNTAFDLKKYLDDAKTNTQILSCKTRHGITFPKLCDGRPDCRDFSDECDNCESPPTFCNDTCFSFYPLGDRYCDGVIDEAWMFINNTACPRGFDETNCPDRFSCKSGDKVSIWSSQICDGRTDCDDGSDEKGCSTSFSSETEMIANPVLRNAFWIMGVVVIMGNAFVIITTIRLLRVSTLTGLIQYQHVIILNISCADFIMGIYLITVAVFSKKFSGYYGLIDVEWRASLRCSIIGSLAVISSETSCFLMVTLTALRLYSVYRPFASLTASAMPWKLAMFCSWLISIVLGILPIPHRTLHYFVHSIFFPNLFNPKGVWSKTNLSKFACHFAALQNLTIKKEGSDWGSTRNFLESNFPGKSPLKEFGYYGETSVCMPRLYVAHGDNAWEYPFTVITVNFLAFVFIAVSYVLVYIRSKKQTKKLHQNNKKLSKQESRMQQRIARIITTDFACWIPICIMSYAGFSGLKIPFVVYQISAVFMLPINSALNPFLYSSLPDKLMEKLVCCNKPQQRSVDASRQKSPEAQRIENKTCHAIETTEIRAV